MYQISSPEICHKALVIWSLASLQSLLSIPFPGRMASSSSTLNSFPPQSLCSCCSLYLVCCSPTPHVAAPTQEDSPSVTLSERALFGLPKQKASPAIFSHRKHYFSFRACIIICNYIHVCAYLVNLCLLHKD